MVCIFNLKIRFLYLVLFVPTGLVLLKTILENEHLKTLWFLQDEREGAGEAEIKELNGAEVENYQRSNGGDDDDEYDY